MSLISAIRAAFSFSASAAQTLSDGLSEAAGADVQKRLKQNLSGRPQNHEPSDGDKKEKEKASQPAVTFTIPEHNGPIKEPEFKPEPLPPLPPKPPPFPPKKLAPINNASKQNHPPIKPKPAATSTSTTQSPFEKKIAEREKAREARALTKKEDGLSI